MSGAIAIDQGTTATKSLVLEPEGGCRLVASRRHRQLYPRPGWVEHDPLELLANVRATLEAAVADAPGAGAVGLSNQGETVVAWDARDGRPLANAIVWQDDRTGAEVERLRAEGLEALTIERAGLPLDPYFSATKLRWILDHVPGARKLLRAGRLRLGTSDAFLLDRMTGRYATDPTTASRTSLMDLRRRCWDPDLCEAFGVPVEALPEIRATAGDFGTVRARGREVRLTASAVDQQAALFGHGCSHRGDGKMTFGTGAFALVNTGTEPLARAEEGVLATLAWVLPDGTVHYAADGGVYNAASAVDWAGRATGAGAVPDAFEGEPAIVRGLAFVPALSGLGCPHWDRTAAGLWIGLGLDTEPADLVRAAIEGVALRSAEVLDRLGSLAGRPDRLPVDGGLTGNGYFCQMLADASGLEVELAGTPEVTALGAARLALLGAGLVPGSDDLPPRPPPLRRYEPGRDLRAERERFATAVERARGWRNPEADSRDPSPG